MLTRLVYLYVACCVLALRAPAQGVDVRGVVVDSASGERVPYANVVIRGTNKGASTNLNGFYLLPNVPPGNREIVASGVGYAPTVKRLSVRMGDPLTLNFRLAQRPVALSEVVVEGEGGLEKLDAASIHILDSRDIQRVPVAGQEDVLRAIQTLPGVVSTADVSSKFYVRGGAGDQNLVLLDGMKIYNPYHAFGIFSAFDPDIIRSAEIYTGAFPAGYGNRLSSVLNLTTRQGNTSRVAAKSELNFLATKLQVEGPIVGDYSWIVSGRKSLFDGPYKHFLNTNVPLSFYDLFFKATIGNESGRSSFRGFFSGDEIATDKPDEPNYSWENRSLAVSVSGLAGDRVYVDALAYSGRFKVYRDAKSSTVLRPAESTVSDDGIRLDAALHTDAGDVLRGGFQFDFPEFAYSFSTRANSDLSFSSFDPELWLWLRHEKEFASVRTDVGLHIDAMSLFDHGPSISAFQPRVSFLYRISDLWNAKCSYGVSTQRVITISNEDDIISLFEAWVPIPSESHTEEAHQGVVGLEGFLSSQLTLGVQSYYKYTSSLVLYNRRKLFPSDPDFLDGKGKAYGAELLARFASSSVDLYLAYSLGWTRVTNNGVAYSPRYDRRHTMNLLGIVHLLDDVDIALRWELGSGYPFTQTVGYYDRVSYETIGGGQSFGENGAPYSILGEKNAARLPTYYRLDGSITYRFDLAPIRGSVGVNIANMTNRRNILFYDRKTGQQINMLDFFPSAVLKLEL